MLITTCLLTTKQAIFNLLTNICPILAFKLTVICPSGKGLPISLVEYIQHITTLIKRRRRRRKYHA